MKMGPLTRLAALLGAAALASVQAQPQAIPAAAFYRAPEIARVMLSPSGQHLALLVSSDKLPRAALAVMDLQAGGIRVVALGPDADVEEAHWVNDDLLVFELGDRLRGGGDQPGSPGLFSVPRTGGVPRRLIDTNWNEVRGATNIQSRTLSPAYALLHVLGKSGTEVIVGRHEWDGSGEVKAVLPLALDVSDGRSRTLAQGMPEGAKEWMFDAGGEPRVAAVFKDGTRRVFWRGGDGKTWRMLDESPYDRHPWSPQHLDGSDGLLVSVASGRNGEAALYRLDVATGKPTGAPLVSTPGFDYHGVPVREAETGRVLGVRVVTDAETTVWFDDRMKKAQAAADARLPGHVNRLSCARCSSDDPVVLAFSFNDTDPGRYALHHPAKNTWREIGARMRDIDPRRMATLDFHRIKARDGLELPVWVTTPRGPKPAAPRPAVLLVHGGPWVRGSQWRWDADAQFLASRGYVVIEPEFRGSTGYGARLFQAGWKQWGLAMQDDLLDTLDWAARQGLVDAKRTCIAGASYGGYATLMALARDPDVFRCGVAWADVSDPQMMFKWSRRSDISEEARLYSLRDLIGEPDKDAEAFKRITPVLRAADMKAPLLLAHGGQDRRVLPENGLRMRDALRSAGRAPEWVEYKDEGHGWHNAETRIDFATRMERFLARHLQP